MRKLEYESPHLYFDYKQNNSILRKNFPRKMHSAQLVTYESFMSARFDLYAPTGYRLDSLVVAAPDVLDAIDEYHLGADIEIIGNQLYYIFPKDVVLGKQLQNIVQASELLANAINDNLSRYIDQRAINWNQPIGYDGRRLIKR